MRTRNRLLLAAALAALLVAGALPLLAAAHRPTTPRTDLGTTMLQRAAQRLDLTPEQRQQIQAIFAGHKRELEAELVAMEAARGKLWDAVHAEAPNEQAIRAAAAAVGRVEGDVGVTRAAIAQEVRAVLTPEQQAELQQMVSDLRSFVESIVARIKARLDSLPG